MVYENFLLCTGSCDSQWLAAISSYAKQKNQTTYVTYVLSLMSLITITSHITKICHLRYHLYVTKVISNLTLLHGFCPATTSKRERPSQQDNLLKKKRKSVYPVESV